MLRCPRPRPRGLAPPRSSAAKLAPPSATLIAKICQKFKKSYFPHQSPFARKAGSTLDVRGLWHARPLPSILLFTSHGLRPRTTHLSANYLYLFQPCQTFSKKPPLRTIKTVSSNFLFSIPPH